MYLTTTMTLPLNILPPSQDKPRGRVDLVFHSHEQKLLPLSTSTAPAGPQPCSRSPGFRALIGPFIRVTRLIAYEVDSDDEAYSMYTISTECAREASRREAKMRSDFCVHRGEAIESRYRRARQPYRVGLDNRRLISMS